MLVEFAEGVAFKENGIISLTFQVRFILSASIGSETVLVTDVVLVSTDLQLW